MTPLKFKDKSKSSDSGKKHGKIDVKCINEALIEEFGRLLPRVFFLETVAASLNVNRTTWRKWLAIGRTEALKMDENEDYEPEGTKLLYLKFYRTYRQSLARGETNLLNLLGEAAERQWQAAAWLLERRFPNKWAQDRKEMAEIKRQIRDLEMTQIKNKEIDQKYQGPRVKLNVKGVQKGESN